MRYLFYTVVWAIALTCVFMLIEEMERLNAIDLSGHLNLIAFAIALSLLNYLLRAVRWRFFLAQLNIDISFRYCVLTYFAGFAFTLTPGKVGELGRAHYYRHHATALKSTVAALLVERLIDLVVMLTLVAIALSAASSFGVLWIASVFIVGATFAVLVGGRWPDWAKRLQEETHRPSRWRSFLSRIMYTLEDAKSLLNLKLLALAFALGMLAWGAEAWGFWVISVITPSSTLDLTTAVGIYALAIVVGALTFLPGGLGSTEAAMTALLTAQGYSFADAVTLTLLCRFITLWFAVGLGWIAVLALRHPRSEYAPER